MHGTPVDWILALSKSITYCTYLLKRPSSIICIKEITRRLSSHELFYNYYFMRYMYN